MFNFSFKEFGQVGLGQECCWFPVATLRSSVLNTTAGGLSSMLLQRFPMPKTIVIPFGFALIVARGRSSCLLNSGRYSPTRKHCSIHLIRKGRAEPSRACDVPASVDCTVPCSTKSQTTCLSTSVVQMSTNSSRMRTKMSGGTMTTSKQYVVLSLRFAFNSWKTYGLTYKEGGLSAYRGLRRHVLSCISMRGDWAYC